STGPAFFRSGTSSGSTQAVTTGARLPTTPAAVTSSSKTTLWRRVVSTTSRPTFSCLSRGATCGGSVLLYDLQRVESTLPQRTTSSSIRVGPGSASPGSSACSGGR